ncbi:MAG: exodeoxyribonuclease VII large subunit [Pseudomonadota bacterium]
MSNDLGWPFDEDEDPAPTQSNVAEFSVSEISFALKRTVEDTFGYVRIRGELGRVSRPASGHVYLDLKDEKAVLSGVIWKGVASRLKVQPEQGLEVIVTGKITTFPGQSKYQVVIDAMEPAGAGALMALLEERRKKLAGEGLFDEERKRALPYLPEVIGVVTSPSGAVIRDILHRLADRFPRHVLVWPVRVQGETSGAEVAAGIRGFNALEPGGEIPRPDVIIVARGGGSLEDLWGFNEEAVVRAAAESEIPLISAVGHETDWTLIDHAADHRAPTPTGAAERAVPVRLELASYVDDQAARLRRAMRRGLTDRQQALRSAARGLPRLEDAMSLPRQRLDAAAGRLDQALRASTQHHRNALTATAARLSDRSLRDGVLRRTDTLSALTQRAKLSVERRLETHQQRLDTQAKLLNTLGYYATLQRGFALVRDGSGKPIRSVAQAKSGMAAEVQFHDGSVGATLHGPGAGAKPKAAKKAVAPKDGQGSLF